jgi:hypothetical protein
LWGYALIIRIQEIPFWEKYIVRLVAEDGRFIFYSSESVRAGTPPLNADLSFRLILSSGTVDYGLEWSEGKEGGTMNAAGVVNLPARKATFFETIVTRSEVRLARLQLAPFGGLIFPAPDIPSASGLADGSFTVVSSGREQLDLFGYLSVADMELKSGLADNIYPGLDWLNIRFDGGMGNGDWFCNELIVQSEHGKLSANGKGSLQTGAFGVTASLQILKENIGGQADLRADGFFTPFRLMIRDIDLQVRDLMFVTGDGLKIEQDRLAIRTIRPKGDAKFPVTVQKLEIETSEADWHKRGGGLSGYDWQTKRLFAHNLQIESELRDETVFARVHPLFGPLATATGRLDVQVDELYWPMIAGEEEKASFISVFDVSGVNFESREVLTEALSPLQISGHLLELMGNEIFCRGEGGSISCLPVVMSFADTDEVTISGRTGMDSYLDYLLETPADKGSSAFTGISLRGTVKDPVFDR